MRDDMARPGCVDLDLLPQAVDVNPERVLEDLLSGPDSAEQVLVGNDSWRAAQQNMKELGFGRRQGDLASLDDRHLLMQAEGEVIVDPNHWPASEGTVPEAAQDPRTRATSSRGRKGLVR